MSGAADATRWRIEHVDLSAPGTPHAPLVPAQPTVMVWWWNALPLGTTAYLAEELPLGADQHRALAARLVAQQLAARSAALGGIPAAGGDGHPKKALSLDEVRAFDGIDAIDALGTPATTSAAQLAVIVCTRDRPDALRDCLAALLRQDAPAGEILVVDNSTSGSAQAVCAQQTGVRWLHEPRPGLSVARNAGLRACRLPLVAFTDDDVQVHPHWTAELVRAFETVPDAEAVTGLVLPAVLDTPAQSFFQFDMGAFGSSFIPIRFDHEFFDETLWLGPQVWRIGAGANMAFRHAVFDRIGLFDERLGAGASGCSEDSEIWYRILASGGVCFYEPRAVVHHTHRADWPGLWRQMRAYMQGHVSALLVQHARHGHRGNLRRALKQLPQDFFNNALDLLQSPSRPKARLLGEQVLGWARGMLYALRPGWRHQPLP